METSQMGRDGLLTILRSNSIAALCRLSFWRLGPTFKSASTDRHNIILHFEHPGTGLIGTDGGEKAKGFKARYALGKWRSVTDKIIGTTGEIPVIISTRTLKPSVRRIEPFEIEG